MVIELLAVALLRAQAAAAAAILLVLLLRGPARRLVGAQLAYRLWSLALVAAIASVFPSLSDTLSAGVPPPAIGPDRAVLILGTWLAGALVSLTVLVARERAFRELARRGRAGPAVMGVLWPRLVTPRDFSERFTVVEREMICAHERMHIKRGDPIGNLVIASCLVLGWFNPLVHVAAACARLDQELACDAAVIARRPADRRRYAEALVKAHTRAEASPLACFWSALAPHPMVVRVGMLSRSVPDEAHWRKGAAAVGSLAVLTAVSVWVIAPRGPTVTDVAWPGDDVRGREITPRLSPMVLTVQPR